MGSETSSVPVTQTIGATSHTEIQTEAEPSSGEHAGKFAALRVPSFAWFLAGTTLTFSIVPRRLAPGAVALVQTGWAVMRSLGPAIGGFFVLWFGPTGNFFVQAVAYAFVTFLTNVYRDRLTGQLIFHPQRKVRCSWHWSE